VGRTLEVLFQQARGTHWYGYSDNYIEVAVKSEVEKNTIQSVLITAVEKDSVFGELCN
jgi:hypothetical protein